MSLDTTAFLRKGKDKYTLSEKISTPIISRGKQVTCYAITGLLDRPKSLLLETLWID